MQVQSFSVAGPLLLKPARHGDKRGFLSETYRADVFGEVLGLVQFVQDNVSRSALKGTVRGLHYQCPPRDQGKLVRCSRGAVLDVAVDGRRGSPTYGQAVAVELSDDNGEQLWVPSGFLHGFCTLADDSEVTYKLTDLFSPPHEGSIAFDDPDLNVPWPVDRASAVLSARDAEGQPFATWSSPFRFDGALTGSAA